MKTIFFVIGIIFGSIGIGLYEKGYQSTGIWIMLNGSVALYKFIEDVK